MNKASISADTLPLPVREQLMRGQHDNAVQQLVDDYGLTAAEAEQLIEDYRQNLRDRKVALDIQIMHAQNAKETREQHYLYWRWGMRITLLVIVLILLYQIAGSIK